MLEIKPFDIAYAGPVIIYGGTIWGKAVYEYLKSKNIAVQAILDKNQSGDVIGNIVVEAPGGIDKYKDIPVIICSTRGFRSMCDFLEEKGFKEAYHATPILEQVDWDGIKTWDSYNREEMLGKYLKYVHDYQGGNIDEIELGEMNVIITDVCNLKCDMCLARCTDKKKAIIYPVEELIKSYEKFLSQIKCVYKIIICGGEPMVHPDLDRFIDFCVGQEKIKRIELLTNATFVPNDKLAKSISNEKVRLVLDDYDNENQKIEEIKKICKEKGVDCLVKKLEYWHDLSLLENQNYSEDELCHLYRECTESQNYTLVDNKIVNCYRTFVDMQCGDWDKSIKDYYIDLNDFGYDDPYLKTRFIEMMQKRFIERCKYCVGTGEKAKRIPVAVQRLNTND